MKEEREEEEGEEEEGEEEEEEGIEEEEMKSVLSFSLSLFKSRACVGEGQRRS